MQLTRTDLMLGRNFGPRSLREVRESLAALGLSLGMPLEPATRDAIHARLAAREAASEAHDVRTV